MVLVPMNSTIDYLIFFQRDHPLADKQGRVYYHRHVAMLKEGRVLTSKDVVHHKDGNRLNNDPENLEVTTKAEHGIIHKHRHLTDKDCVQCGKSFVPDKAKRRFCSPSCYNEAQRRIQFSDTQLREMAKTMNKNQLAKKCGVSWAAINKRLSGGIGE